MRDESGNPIYSSENLPKITAKHPRLLINEDLLPAVRERLNKEAYKTSVENLIDSRDRDLDGVFPPAQNGAGNYVGQVGYTAQANALYYMLTGEDAYADKAIMILMNAIQSFEYATSGSGDAPSRDAGYMLDTVARVYDWCYDKLSWGQKETLILKTKNIAKQMQAGFPVRMDSGAVTGHVTEAQIQQCYLSCGIAFYDEDREFFDSTMSVLLDRFVPVRDFAYASHEHFQGTGYGPYRGSYELMADILLSRAGWTDLYSKDGRYLPYTYILNRRPDGLILTDGDTDDQEYGNFYLVYPQYLIYGATLYEDPYLQYAINHYPNALQNIQEVKYTAPEIFLVYDDTLPEKSYSDLPLTTYLPSPGGTMIARTDWKNGIAANTVVAKMKVKEYFWSNHDHSDAGSFQLYYKGLLAKHSGVYNGYFSDHDKSYYKRTIASNSLLVYDPEENWGDENAYFANDGGQNTKSWRSEAIRLEDILENCYRSGKVLAHYIGPNEKKPTFSYLKGDISYAYSANKVQYMTRSFVFINLNNEQHPAALLTYDKITSVNPNFKKYWLLHTIQEPTINGNVSTVMRDEDGYGGKLVNTTVLPEQSNTKIEVIGGKENHKEYDVFGTNYEMQPIAGDDVNDEKDTWRIQISPRVKEKDNTFLNVIQVMDPEIEPLEVVRVDFGAMEGVRLANKMVLFAKAKSKIRADIEIAIPAGVDEVLLCDMDAGKWDVRFNGEPFGVISADGDGSCITLAVVAGIYTFKTTTNGLSGINQTPQIVTPEEETKAEGNDDAAAPITLVINSKKVTDVEVREQDKDVFLPLKAMIKHANGTLTEREDGTVLIQTDYSTGTLTNGSTQCEINGQPVTLKFAPSLENNDYWMEYEDIAKALGATVKYNDFARAIYYKVRVLPENEYLITNIFANVPTDTGYPETNAIDGTTNTRSAIDGDGSYFQFEIPEAAMVSRIGIAWHRGNLRYAYFDLQASEDGEHFETVYQGQSSGTTLQMEQYELTRPIKAKYFRLVNHGNSTGTWCSPTELAVYKD